MKLLTLLVLVLSLQVSAQEIKENPQEVPYKSDSAGVYTTVEEPAEFPEGNAAMYSYLGKTLRYPQNCKDSNIQGNVYVSFVVEPDGTFSDVKILKGVHKDLDNEALRAIKTMPRWKPGKINGKPVRNKVVIPIKFKIN